MRVINMDKTNLPGWNKKTQEWDCEQCGGACCKGRVTSSAPDPRMTEFLETCGPTKDGVWYIRSVCTYLHAGRCSCYETRPQICRLYEVGGEKCIKAQEMYGKKITYPN